jgi:hypothetical protein
MPCQWFFKYLDPDGTRPLVEVYKEVQIRSVLYCHLVVTCKYEGDYDFPNAFEVYESFVWITRKRNWGKYPAACTCNSTNCLCHHVLLTCAAFDETVQVQTNRVAKTPELRKKTNRQRGTAGPRRITMIVAIAKDKAKSVSKESKLTFMDPPIGQVPQEPQPQPGAANLVIPPAGTVVTVITIIKGDAGMHRL